MIIAVIEWSSDSASSPTLWVVDTPADGRRAAARHIAEQMLPAEPGDDGSLNYIDWEWVEENPVPDFDDDAAVERWLDALRDATTDAWLTLYTAADAHAEATYEDEYIDLRNTTH